MENKIIKTILFNILVVLTLIFIFLLLFPKKSYVESKINEETKEQTDTVQNNMVYDETFKNNFTSMKIASINYFEKNESKKVTLKELKDNEYLLELKDSEGVSCSNDSYAEKNEETMTVNLVCNNTNKEAQINLKTYEEDVNDKLICIYEYQKVQEPTYTEWGEWSEWQKDKVEQDDLTKVETKKEKTDEPQRESKPAKENKIINCPDGYKEDNSQCKLKTEINKINASVAYNCPSGYKKTGTNCYKDTEKIEATKEYYCPNGDKFIEYDLSGTECIASRVSYLQVKEEKYYTCESGYELSGSMCFRTSDSKEITYYRYKKRNITDEKIDIKWSIKNDKELLNQEYNMVREITCDF